MLYTHLQSGTQGDRASTVWNASSHYVGGMAVENHILPLTGQSHMATPIMRGVRKEEMQNTGDSPNDLPYSYTSSRRSEESSCSLPRGLGKHNCQHLAEALPFSVPVPQLSSVSRHACKATWKLSLSFWMDLPFFTTIQIRSKTQQQEICLLNRNQIMPHPFLKLFTSKH